jgi:hypothetical protein
MAMLRSEPRLVAVLGPTNTGKTHLAIERMLDHQSGMIGFPLRLLARENYDRVVKLRGARAVALITGEEKTRSSSVPIPSAAMSSPPGCCMPAGSARRCFSARIRSGP